MLDPPPGVSALHVAHIGADLIYATSYDKPKEYVEEILAEVGRLVMREVSTRTSDGTPRYALEIARQRSHSAKHPLMVHGYLAASKVDQSSQRRQAYRSQSARETRPDGEASSSGGGGHARRLLFYRPESRRLQRDTRPPAALQGARVAACWDSGPSSTYAAVLGGPAHSGAPEVYVRPNKTILLRTRSSESSAWDAALQLERLPKNHGDKSTWHRRQRAKDSELKLKLMSRDFARSADSLHAFLVGAKYNNRSRGITEAVANGLAGRSVERSETATARSPVSADAAEAALDASYTASRAAEEEEEEDDEEEEGGGESAAPSRRARRSGGGGSTASSRRTRARPVSAVAAANDQAARWTQLHADNPPLYTRPSHSGVAEGGRRPRDAAASRPLSALHKAIVIRQLPSASLAGAAKPAPLKKAGISPGAHFAPAAVLKTSRRPGAAQYSVSASSSKSASNGDALQIVSRRVVQHAHARMPFVANSQQSSEIRTTDEANATSKTFQTKRNVPASADRPSDGQLGNAGDISDDGLGVRLFNGDTGRAHESASSVDVRGSNLDPSHIDHALQAIRSSGGEQKDKDIPVAIPQPIEEVDREDSPEIAAANETPMSSRLSIHVDVAVLQEGDDYSHASDNGDDR